MKIFFSILLLTLSQFIGAQQNALPKVEIKSIGSPVNSTFSDFAPLISADGSTMVFTSLRPADKLSTSTNTTVKKDGQKSKEANAAIYITYYDDKSKTWLEPIMLESVINLAGVDNSAIALSNDGQRMLIYRGGNNKNINKGVFETTLKGNEWSVPKRLPAPINTDGNETSASFSSDGKSIYFVSSRPDGLGGKDIWYCLQNEAGDWGEAVNAGNSINTKEDEESVFLHPNGSSLFFSSKGHGSSGGYDVFVSHLDSTTNGWAQAINLGSVINTPGDDLYFVMAADEKTAYYTSSKSKALADKDIYKITFGESILTKHTTLVKGFVTGENGLGIESKIVVKEKSTGDIINTIKSNKATGKFLVSLPSSGEYQINFTDDNNGTYTEFIEASEKNGSNEVVLNILLEPKYANLFSRVLDEEGNPINKVQIELIDIITKQLIGRFETNSAGASRFSLPFETKFNIVFNKHGYLFQSVNVSIPKSSGSESKDIKDITMQKVEVGKKIVVNNVFFDFNQEIPQQQSFADLDRIIKLMKDMNSLHLEISGHTDNVGFQDNKKLSEQKAKAVMNYLVAKGCEKSRLKYKGYGSTDPIATNETAEGRQINSRIEIKVLKVDIIEEQAAEEKRIQSGSDIAKSDELISPYPIINEQENVAENKDSVAAANKKDENLDAIKVAFGEEQSQENKEIIVDEVKKDEKTEDTPVVIEEEKNQENKETIVADVKKDEKTEDTPVVIEEEKVVKNNETIVAEVKKEEKTEDTPVVIEEEKVVKNNETIVADVKKEEKTEDTPVVIEEEKVVGNNETIVAEVKKEEKTEDTPVVIEEEKVVENNETIVAEVKKEEKTEDIPVAIEEEKIAKNNETIVADVKTVENEDTSKEALLKKNEELAKKIDAMEQKYKASLDSVVKVSWGAEGNPIGEEQDINADSMNQEYSKEEVDTTVVAGNEENSSSNEENAEQSEIVTDENAVSAEDSVSMEIKNIGSLVNSRFPDYTPLIHADGNVMIFSTNRPLTETAIPVAPPAKKGKPQKPDNKGGNANIYTSYYDLKDKKWLAPIKLGPTINLPNVNNSAIALSNDGQKMILYRYDGNQTENGDLFESSLNGEEWSPPLRLPASINSNDNETSASISPDGKTIYFVSNRKPGVGEKDIWYSTQENTGIWGNPVNIGESINTDKDEESVFIHPNGNTLFFSSKGHNSIGGYDIFMSVLDSATGEWGTPKNLGRSINTPEDDMYFTLAANGKKGYYSSSKLNGIGETDIYSVVLGSDIIKKNTTLVKGFITDENGEGIKSKIEIIDKSTDETFGIFNSNRITGKFLVSLPTGKKYDLKITADGYTAYNVSLDISFKRGYNEIVKNIVLETKNVFITSRTYNETGKPVSVLIEAMDNASLQLIDKSESDNEGYSKIAVTSGKELDIFFSKPGYLFQSVKLSVAKSTEFESKDLKNITLQKVGVGKKTVLKNISFDFNQTIPLQESFLDIDRIVTLMKDVASVEIEISGHTDNVGSKKDNAKLSNERAKALVDLLISKGIDKKRLEYKGYGSNEPIGSNDTESGRKANNRTELKVLKVDLKAEELAEERRIKEAPVADVVSLKPDEIIVSVDEKQAQENNDTVAITDTKDSNNNAPIGTEEEKIQENKETIVADVKTDEKQDASKDALPDENQESAMKTEAMEKKYKESLDSVLKASWGNDPNEQVEVNKETEIVNNKEEKTDTPIAAGEEKSQENEEIIVADKKDENSETPVVAEEEKIQENNETIIADKKETNNSGNFSRHALESYATEKKEGNSKPNKVEIIHEKQEPQEVVADKKEDTTEEEVQSEETKETTIAVNEDPLEIVADKKEETADPTDIVKSEEIKETAIAVNEEPLEVVTDKKEETADPTDIVKSEEPKETILPVNDAPLEVVTNKKEETADPTDIVKSEEPKETDVNEITDTNAAKKESTELATKSTSTNASLLPERYKEFDKDENGAITYDEIIKMIDAFFDDAPNVTQEDITSIIDYFFGE